MASAPHLHSPGTHRPAGHTGDLGGLPATILLAADQWLVALGQPLAAPVTKHGVDFIAPSWAAKHLSQGQLWRRPTGHCRGDTVKIWEPGSAGDSSQSQQEEEEGVGHRVMQKRAEIPGGPPRLLDVPLPMAWDTFLTPL